MPRQKVALRAALLFALALMGFVHTTSGFNLLSFAVAATSPAATSSLYLPIIFGQPPVPQLLTPTNGSNASLAPVLSWTLPVTGTYQVQLGTDSTFATTLLSKTIKYTDTSVSQGSTLSSNSNLNQQTTFFWRVGVLFRGAFSYSPISTFTTPKEDASLLPAAPVIVGAEPLTDTVTLSWQPVANALYYRVNIDTPEHLGFIGLLVQAPKTTEKVEKLTPNKTYTWRVRALTAAGWSKDAKGTSFTTQP